MKSKIAGVALAAMMVGGWVSGARAAVIHVEYSGRLVDQSDPGANLGTFSADFTSDDGNYAGLSSAPGTLKITSPIYNASLKTNLHFDIEDAYYSGFSNPIAVGGFGFSFRDQAGNLIVSALNIRLIGDPTLRKGDQIDLSSLQSTPLFASGAGFSVSSDNGSQPSQFFDVLDPTYVLAGEVTVVNQLPLPASAPLFGAAVMLLAGLSFSGHKFKAPARHTA